MKIARLLLFLLIIIFLSSCTTPPAMPINSTTQEQPATSATNEQAFSDKQQDLVVHQVLAKEEQKYFPVTHVVDGDTIDVNINGAIERVRLIGIDTPEVVDPRKPVECFGVEASNKAKAILSAQSVSLENDDSQSNRDKYDRLLRYVFLQDGTNFNKLMIEQGYAHEYTYDLPYKYQQEFKQAQTYARENKLGLWQDNICQTQTAPIPVPISNTNQNINLNTNTNAYVAPPPVVPVPEPKPATTGCVIKGNISSSGEKIYHVPGCSSYNVTVITESKGERWFCTEADALAAGWRKALNCPK